MYTTVRTFLQSHEQVNPVKPRLLNLMPSGIWFTVHLSPYHDVHEMAERGMRVWRQVKPSSSRTCHLCSCFGVVSIQNHTGPKQAPLCATPKLQRYDMLTRDDVISGYGMWRKQ